MELYAVATITNSKTNLLELEVAGELDVLYDLLEKYPCAVRLGSVVYLPVPGGHLQVYLLLRKLSNHYSVRVTYGFVSKVIQFALQEMDSMLCIENQKICKENTELTKDYLETMQKILNELTHGKEGYSE